MGTIGTKSEADTAQDDHPDNGKKPRHTAAYGLKLEGTQPIVVPVLRILYRRR